MTVKAAIQRDATARSQVPAQETAVELNTSAQLAARESPAETRRQNRDLTGLIPAQEAAVELTTSTQLAARESSAEA
jgi:hypothetical protein